MRVWDVAFHLDLDPKTIKAVDKQFLAQEFGGTDCRDLRILAVGEISLTHGQNGYMTVVLDYLTGRVVWMGQGRKKETLDAFFALMTPEQKQGIAVVAPPLSWYRLGGLFKETAVSDMPPSPAQPPKHRASAPPLAGGIEAGGTKFVCLVGSGPDHIVAETRFPTTTPAETLDRTIAFFKPHIGPGALAAIGLACFGPVDLNEASPTYGHITSTPKPGWAHTDMVGPLRRALGLPVAFESDVNAAAVGEHHWVADNRRCSPLVYFTVGTGIGGGIVLGGKPVHGLVHPEAGHVRLPHDWQADPFPGVCPFHGDCFEGLASGPAMRARWGRPAEELPPEHPAWNLEATYIALAMANVICTLSPQRIVLGGGVMQQTHLLPMVRQKVTQILNQYIQSPVLLAQMDAYIVPPALSHRSGVLGALALAQQAWTADSPLP